MHSMVAPQEWEEMTNINLTLVTSRSIIKGTSVSI